MTSSAPTPSAPPSAEQRVVVHMVLAMRAAALITFLGAVLSGASLVVRVTRGHGGLEAVVIESAVLLYTGLGAVLALRAAHAFASVSAPSDLRAVARAIRRVRSLLVLRIFGGAGIVLVALGIVLVLAFVVVAETAAFDASVAELLWEAATEFYERATHH